MLIRKTQIREKLVIPEEFNISKEIMPEQQTLHSYGDRSINKEIDQMVSIIRSKHSGNSTLEPGLFHSHGVIDMVGSQPQSY
jgi:hypothetical protein